MMLHKLALPRRTFLRGAGTALALPLLDAMVPAATALAKTAAAPVPRLGFVYVPNGQALVNWIPDAAGTDFAFKPTHKPLEAFRSHVTIVSGLSNLEAESRGVTTAPHTRCGSVWLNGVRPKRTEGVDIRAGKTVDQFAADKLGETITLRSLEIALESNYSVGNCDNGYSCAYINTFSWRTPTVPLPMESSPRAVFERLFGDGDTVEARRGEMRWNRSIIDAVRTEISGLARVLGPADRAIVSEYLDAVREVERRIQFAEARAAVTPEDLTAPVGIPDKHWDFAELMYDLMLLAYQTDITRVVAFQMAREQSVQTYPWIGVSEGDHDISHHGLDPEKTERRTKVNTYHVANFAKFVEKAAKTKDGDGSLLDHMMVLYGSGIGDGNVHSCHNLPLMVVGGGAGKMKGGRHMQYALDTPMMNLGVSLLEKVGVDAQVGDSTGRLADL
ncbi:MAG: DUF1552 domain-containing protein [Alphaproteobacteria bacterium]